MRPPRARKASRGEASSSDGGIEIDRGGPQRVEGFQGVLTVIVVLAVLVEDLLIDGVVLFLVGAGTAVGAQLFPALRPLRIIQ